MADVEAFDDFIARTAAARWGAYAEAFRASGASAGANPADEFERMRAYILRTYEGVHPVGSFRDPEGRPVDCVLFDQQPSVRAARAAGEPVPVSPAPERPREGRPGARPAPCPFGSVPMVRITLERLVPHGTLENYLR